MTTEINRLEKEAMSQKRLDVILLHCDNFLYITLRNYYTTVKIKQLKL